MKGDWPVKALGDLFEISRGGSPRPIQDFLTEEADGVNWIMISDASASGKYIERTAKRIRIDGVARSRRVSPGDFLLTNSMSFGRPYIMKIEGCIHDGWLHLKKRDKSIDEDYFYHLLGSETTYAKFERLAAGATVKNLNIDLVSSVEVPVPPLLEQRRIATILDKADSLRRKRQEAIRLEDEFLKAVFFERFAAKPRSRVLADYCDFLAGFAFKSDQYIEPRDGVLLLRGINVGIDRFEWGDSAGYPLKAVNDLARYRLEQGDVVLAMDRPWISTGLKCAVVDERVAGSYLVQRVARLRPKQQGMSAFIMNCLQGNDFKSHCRITETTIPHISPKDFATFPVPTATDAELRSFADIAARIKRISSRAEQAAISSEELTSSLQATIFNMH